MGTKIGNGCTSGHGVCGLPRFSKRSWVAVPTFMIFGFIFATAKYHGEFLRGESMKEDLEKVSPTISVNILLGLAIVTLCGLLIYFHK